jgi:hypothetical protein
MRDWFCFLFFGGNWQGIRKLCEDLLDLKRSSAEEMRKSVYANYAAFIRCVSSLPK